MPQSDHQNDGKIHSTTPSKHGDAPNTGAPVVKQNTVTKPSDAGEVVTIEPPDQQRASERVVPQDAADKAGAGDRDREQPARRERTSQRERE